MHYTQNVYVISNITADLILILYIELAFNKGFIYKNKILIGIITSNRKFCTFFLFRVGELSRRTILIVQQFSTLTNNCT